MIIQEIRKILAQNNYPPKFEPNEWKECLSADCYTYALNLKLDEGFMIGDFIGKRVTYHDSPKLQKQVFIEEMIALGFDIIECETEDCLLVSGSFKIYIEWDEDNYYHFLREDSDGVWSHKQEGHLPNRRDQTGYIIEDPDCMVNAINNYGQCFMLSL